MALVRPRLALLRSATAETHQKLEERLTLLGPELATSSYANYLSGLLDAVEPLEQALLTVPDLQSAWPDVRERQKAPLLRQDLAELDCPAGPPGPLQYRIDDLATALGVGYVLEGSTLGGEVLRREVERRLGPVPVGYFRCYGDDLRARWVDFLHMLETAPIDDDEEQLVEGAHFAFATVEHNLISRGLMR